MKEIGGYFELEEFRQGEYYSDLIRLNLGRTAFLYLLEKLHCRRIYLPYFLCDSVTRRAKESGSEVVMYHIDRNLTPLLSEKMEEGSYVYLVNYYGQLTDDRILSCQEKFGNIIVDHTHAFFQKPLPHIPTLYSCRKFFGLPDGAYVSADVPEPEDLPLDLSGERMEHILGRYEGNASDYYSVMLANAAAFHREPLKRMSKLTRNLLCAIDYQRVRERRNRNYSFLDGVLGQKNPLQFFAPDGAFCYPFYCRNAQEIRKELAGEKIYIPVYWGDLLTKMPEDSPEYDLAAHILPLPCDQRYGTEDLEHMVRLLTDCLKHYEEK